MNVCEVSLWWGAADSCLGTGEDAPLHQSWCPPLCWPGLQSARQGWVKKEDAAPLPPPMLESPCPEESAGMDCAFLVAGNDSVVWECSELCAREQCLLSAQPWPLPGGLRKCSPLLHHFWLWISDGGGFIYLVLQTQCRAGIWAWAAAQKSIHIPIHRDWKASCHPVDKLWSAEMAPSLLQKSFILCGKTRYWIRNMSPLPHYSRVKALVMCLV